MAGLAADADSNYQRATSMWSCRAGLFRRFCRVFSLSFLRRGPIPFFGDRAAQWWFAVATVLRTRPTNRNSGKLGNLRGFYWFSPFARSTYRDAAAIIAGSSQTYGEFAALSREALLCSRRERHQSFPLYLVVFTQLACVATVLILIFVGALVPYKACDLALRGGRSAPANGPSPLYHRGRRPRSGPPLEQLTRSLRDRESCFVLWNTAPWRSNRALGSSRRAGVSIGSRVRRRCGLRGSGDGRCNE